MATRKRRFSRLLQGLGKRSTRDIRLSDPHLSEQIGASLEKLTAASRDHAPVVRDDPVVDLKMFEHFALVGLSSDDHIQRSRAPARILYSFPEEQAIPYTDLASFCFPDGVSTKILRRTPSGSSIFELLFSKNPSSIVASTGTVFALTGSGGTVWGVACTNMAMLSDLPSFMPHNETATAHIKHSPYNCTAPRMYVLLSRMPYFELHFAILERILWLEHLESVSSPVLQQLSSSFEIPYSSVGRAAGSKTVDSKRKSKRQNAFSKREVGTVVDPVTARCRQHETDPPALDSSNEPNDEDPCTFSCETSSKEEPLSEDGGETCSDRDSNPPLGCVVSMLRISDENGDRSDISGFLPSVGDFTTSSSPTDGSSVGETDTNSMSSLSSDEDNERLESLNMPNTGMTRSVSSFSVASASSAGSGLEFQPPGFASPGPPYSGRKSSLSNNGQLQPPTRTHKRASSLTSTTAAASSLSRTLGTLTSYGQSASRGLHHSIRVRDDDTDKIDSDSDCVCDDENEEKEDIEDEGEDEGEETKDIKDKDKEKPPFASNSGSLSFINELPDLPEDVVESECTEENGSPTLVIEVQDSKPPFLPPHEDRLVTIVGKSQAKNRHATSSSTIRFLDSYHTTAPPRGSRLVFQPLPDVARIETEIPTLLEESLSIAKFAIPIAFQAISLDTFLSLFTALCLERQVVVVSSSTRICSGVLLAMMPLLRPLVWTSVFVPVLPSSVCEVLEAPVPFAVGMTRLPEGVELGRKAVIVDIARNEVRVCGEKDDRLPRLPKAKQLVDSVRPLYDKLRKKRKIQLSTRSSASQEGFSREFLLQEEEISKNVLSVFETWHESVVGKVPGCTITNVSDTSHPVSIFLSDNFVSEFPDGDRPFAKEFAKTQQFATHCDNCLAQRTTEAVTTNVEFIACLQ